MYSVLIFRFLHFKIKPRPLLRLSKFTNLTILFFSAFNEQQYLKSVIWISRNESLLKVYFDFSAKLTDNVVINYSIYYFIIKFLSKAVQSTITKKCVFVS